MATLEKRQPLLVDLLLAEKYRGPDEVYIAEPSFNYVKQKLREAKRFVLDQRACVQLAKVIKEIPDLIVREQQFARAPYDLTWIEWNFKTVYETINEEPVDKETCELTGLLIDNGTIFETLGPATVKGFEYPTISPFYYNLHTPSDMQEEIRLCEQVGISRGQLDYMFWGTVVEKLKEESSLRALRAHHSVGMLPIRPLGVSDEEKRKFLHELFYAQVGVLRNAVALLLMMNRPSLTKYVRDLPQTRTFYKGKSRVYASHTIVTIDVDPIPTMQRIGTEAGEATPKRRHEVRGHYCHDETAREYMRIAGCFHDWQAEAHEDDKPGDVNHWKCANCGGRRWWRRAHLRGDATIGFVTHDAYELTRS